MYDRNVSPQPLSIIRNDECRRVSTDLTGRRFRRLFNELEEAREALRILAACHRAYCNTFGPGVASGAAACLVRADDILKREF